MSCGEFLPPLRGEKFGETLLTLVAWQPGLRSTSIQQSRSGCAFVRPNKGVRWKPNCA